MLDDVGKGRRSLKMGIDNGYDLAGIGLDAAQADLNGRTLVNDTAGQDEAGSRQAA